MAALQSDYYRLNIDCEEEVNNIEVLQEEEVESCYSQAQLGEIRKQIERKSVISRSQGKLADEVKSLKDKVNDNHRINCVRQK
jgi:hypothetical protein